MAKVLSVVIVNWRSADYLKECLASLRSGLADLDAEVIVVDNASHDGSEAVTRACWPGAQFVQAERNLGFSGANNLGCRSATGQFLLFLNPDTRVLGDAVVRLVAALRETPGAGAAGAQLLNEDLTVQGSSVQAFPTILNQVLDAECLRRLLPASRLWGTRVLRDHPAAATDVDVISGACLAVERAAFDRVGGFSEDYFMYSEDVDLCFRLRKAGYRVLYVDAARVVHFGGKSSSQVAGSPFKHVCMRASRYLYFRRHRGGPYAVAYRAMMLLAASLRLAVIAPWHAASVAVGREGRRGSLQKWTAVLRWSLGLARVEGGRG